MFKNKKLIAREIIIFNVTIIIILLLFFGMIVSSSIFQWAYQNMDKKISIMNTKLDNLHDELPKWTPSLREATPLTVKDGKLLPITDQNILSELDEKYKTDSLLTISVNVMIEQTQNEIDKLESRQHYYLENIYPLRQIKRITWEWTIIIFIAIYPIRLLIASMIWAIRTIKSAQT